MAVYLNDTFSGTSGTLLSAHTSDSGAAWPNDSNHSNGGNGLALDGSGGVYLSTTAPSSILSTAAMPGTVNFEVLFAVYRMTAVNPSQTGVTLFSTEPPTTNNWKLMFTDGSGFGLYNGPTSKASTGLSPAVGQKWWIKVDVSTSGGNTTFTARYATINGGPWNPLFSYTTTTPTAPVNVGFVANTATAATATTGTHIVGLVVQDVPSFSQATGYSVAMPGGGHQKTTASATINFTPAGSAFTGTITATPSGAQLFSPIVISCDGTQSSINWQFTPLSADTITWTFTNSGTLANPGAVSFISTGIYLQDSFTGAPGILISGHISNTLLSGQSGGGWSAPTGGAIQLDGNGCTFQAAAPDTQSLWQGALPAISGSPITPLEIQFDLAYLSAVTTEYAQMIFMSSGSGSNQLYLRFHPADGVGSIRLVQNGSDAGAGSTAGPAVGVTWRIRIQVKPNQSNSGYADIWTYYSTNGGSTWNTLLPVNPFTVLPTSLPSAYGVGPYFQATPVTATTGIHVGNVVVQDPLPPPPTCQISRAYVGTSGKTIVFFFSTISGNTPVNPTALNYAPSIFQNGNPIGPGVNAWVTGYHQCAVLSLQSGQQINPGDTVTISTPTSWMTCGAGSVNAVTNLPISNYTGMSCFGTDSLAKTIRPGLNFSNSGASNGTLYNIPKNWRYRLSPSEAGSTNTVDGYPTRMLHPTETLSILDYTGMSNNIDSTNYPGIAGVWAIGFDDNAFGTNSASQLAMVSLNAAQCTVTPVASVSNSGSNGVGQFYAFTVSAPAGATSASLPIGLQWTCPSQTPNISNLWILAPGDFSYTPGTPLSFDRSQPYALSGQFLADLPNGIGSMRWLDSTDTFGGMSNKTEAWELHQLTDFSWNNSLHNTYTIGYTAARPLSVATSPYVYGDFLGSPWTPMVAGSAVTLGAAVLDAPAVGTLETITLSAIPTDLFAGILLQIGPTEKLRVKSISGNTAVVERGSSGTTPVTHAAGEPITAMNRWAWTSLSNLGGVNTQVVEFVTQNPHGLKSGLQIAPGGSFPQFTTTDGTSFNITGGSQPVWVTGPNSFFQLWYNTSTSTTTLTQTYTLNPATNTTYFAMPDIGFPPEFTAMVTGSVGGCNLHRNIPLIATDSYVYAMANKDLANFPAGRKIYLELSDEPWNFAQIQYGQITLISRFAGYSSPYAWYVIRTGQIRAIYRNVFGSRAGEIQALINCQYSAPGNAQMQLAQAQANSVTIDALGLAPYIDPDNSAASVAAWNSADIQQAIDLWIHDLYYNTQGFQAFMAGNASTLAAYNAAMGTSAGFWGYEGGFETGVPAAAGNVTPRSRDMPYDPNWLIIEKDMYALFQSAGFPGINLYSYSIYYSYSNNWGLKHWPGQKPGKGDGSNGGFVNRRCLATPGQTYTKAATTNQDAQCDAVRLQALNEWMAQTPPPPPPPPPPAPTSRTRKLFVPFRKRWR